MSQITEAFLEEKIKLGWEESSNLEFKAQLNLGGDSERKEFLADISSLANTHGGTIYYGISEADGRASACPGIVTANVDQTKLADEPKGKGPTSRALLQNALPAFKESRFAAQQTRPSQKRGKVG